MPQNDQKRYLFSGLRNEEWLPEQKKRIAEELHKSTEEVSAMEECMLCVSFTVKTTQSGSVGLVLVRDIIVYRIRSIFLVVYLY